MTLPYQIAALLILAFFILLISKKSIDKMKAHETHKTDDEIRAAINSRSFELNYNGGTIWCEHLDGMGGYEQEAIEKFTGDLPKLQSPSVSSSMIINLDETVITEAIENVIVNGLAGADKQFRKIAFVGVDGKQRTKFFEIQDLNGAIVKFIDDYEKAKEWVL